MKKRKKQTPAAKISEQINLIPLCLSCIYFALLIGISGTNYLKSQQDLRAILVLIILIVVAYVLGFMTVSRVGNSKIGRAHV